MNSVWAVSMASGMSMRPRLRSGISTSAGGGPDARRRRTSRVSRTGGAPTGVSGSWARQRGGPDELLAVADVDAAFDVSFELVVVMG